MAFLVRPSTHLRAKPFFPLLRSLSSLANTLTEGSKKHVHDDTDRRIVAMASAAVKVLCDQFFTDACLVTTVAMSEGMKKAKVSHAKAAGLRVTELIDPQCPDKPIKSWQNPHTWISIGGRVVDVCSNRLPYLQYAAAQGVDMTSQAEIKKFLQKPQEAFDVPEEMLGESDHPLVGTACILGGLSSVPAFPSIDNMTLEIRSEKGSPVRWLRRKYFVKPPQGAGEAEIKAAYGGFIPNEPLLLEMDQYETVLMTQVMYTRLLPPRVRRGILDAIQNQVAVL
eukprot:comp6182_c0_seq1/m.2015 comp6182_c0_seq1/g.2015  ORF comp6182_c0_seq1/g.2015 comp6182_c0_seq1/m.2015 type:complete len:281 (-) comp6182_c0_seq1:54-896(-)